MSELKVYSQCYDGTDGLFYLKSEADKFIAEKDAEIAQLQAMLEERNRQIGNLDAVAKRNQRAAQTLRKKMNHHKYKRCLDNAKLAVKDDYLPWNMKWHKRWLELAEKFKED